MSTRRPKRRETRKAWAIWLAYDYPGFAGHGFFDWLEGHPHVHGCRIALFATRREATAAIKGRMIEAARVVRVRVTISCL